MQIRDYQQRDLESVVGLSLRDWAPVFVSIERAMDPDVFREFYPDWRPCQQQAVEGACADKNAHVWVAEENGEVVAFAAVFLRSPTFGEIYMIAVDPDFQRRGIATALTDFAVDWMRQQGVTVAMVETGADPGHAPARRTYEKSGFRVLPAARYFKKL
jgi:ribosomal protein S18 acetylase RimI-like enzyme